MEGTYVFDETLVQRVPGATLGVRVVLGYVLGKVIVIFLSVGPSPAQVEACETTAEDVQDATHPRLRIISTGYTGRYASYDDSRSSGE